MTISLKDLNRPMLLIVVVANALAYIALLKSPIELLSVPTLISTYDSYVPAVLITAIVGIMNAQINHINKARLIFWRWTNPLPGSFAFTKVIHSDARIDPAKLAQFQSPLPTEPVDQNRLWFKWYREFQEEPGIKQVHREYLFARDWAGMAALFAITLGPLAFYQMPVRNALTYLVIVLVQYFFVRRAAKNHGERFVANILAYKSASK